jgi:threonine dehydratase
MASQLPPQRSTQAPKRGCSFRRMSGGNAPLASRRAGGKVIRISGTYDAAVIAAREAAARGDGLLIPDTTQDMEDPVVADVMSGYSLITDELQSQLDRLPTHVIVQAGVGGLAAAVAQGIKRHESSSQNPPRRHA